MNVAALGLRKVSCVPEDQNDTQRTNDQQDTIQELKQEVQRLDSQLKSEREKMDEFKERMIRRKDKENEVNKKLIVKMKEELISIETKYIKEVRIMEDRYKEFKKQKKDKYKAKLKDIEKKHQSDIDKERARNRELEIKMAEMQVQFAIL